MPLPKICDKCGTKFIPETRISKLCPNCRKLIRNVNFINMICQRNGRNKIKLMEVKNV